MKLIECYIENFGKLTDFKKSFCDGLNIINRENGYGKTTLSVFIKAMFFGLDESRKSKIEENDRKRYLPWSGARCAGYLIFEANGKRYRIERCFMPKAADDTFKLYDVKSGKESLDYSRNIGEELFGIDADGFERTVFLSEANLSGRTENKRIASKLSDLVGYEGDIGAMDDAIELLEKQRKTYYRKGGAGEIGDVKDRLTDIELKINDLSRMRQSLEGEEERLKELSARLALCNEKRKDLQGQVRAAELARSKRIYERQYREMKAALDEDEESYRELTGFFKNGLPTVRELEEARSLYDEARRIKENTERTSHLHTQATDQAVSEEEYARAKECSEKIKRLEREREIIRENLAIISEKGEKIYPKASDAEQHIFAIESKKISKKENKSLHLLLPVGLISVLLGIALGFAVHPALFAVCAVGAVLIILSLIKGRSPSDAASFDDACKFISAYRSLEGITRENILTVLYELKGEGYAALAGLQKKEELLGESARINDEIAMLSRDACEFLANFKSTDAPSVTLAVDEVLRQHEIRLALLGANAEDAERRKSELMRAEENMKAVSEFLMRFKTLTDRPFDEISTKMIELNALRRSILRTRESIDAFVAEHSIDPAAICEHQAEEYIPNPDDPTLLAEIAELERARTLAERQCRLYGEELDKLDSLYSEREALGEKLTSYLRILDINKKTQALLKEAKDSLTAKYLSKTKAAFDKYMETIASEEPADYVMDTSFGVSRNEKGTLRSTPAYSRGTRDAMLIATRFALVDSLYENEKPFIVLDDPFAYFDDAKLTRSLRVIKKIADQKQVIYFTCQMSREP